MTLKVQYVATDYIHSIFPNVEGFIKSGLDETDDCTIEQAKVFLSNGSWNLLVVTDEQSEIHGVFMYAVLNETNDRTASIISAGGKGIINNQVFNQVCDYFKSLGATRVQALAKKSAARLYEKINMNAKAILTERRLWAD
jgi:hypothetical protein